MNKVRQITIIASLIVGVAMVTGALIIVSVRRHNDHLSVAAVVEHPITHAQLAAADGKHGRICYVAVSGVVYQIKDSTLWVNGQHTPSEGLAYCGADLTNVIDEAPHGRGILDTLPKIGPLVP